MEKRYSEHVNGNVGNFLLIMYSIFSIFNFKQLQTNIIICFHVFELSSLLRNNIFWKCWAIFFASPSTRVVSSCKSFSVVASPGLSAKKRNTIYKEVTVLKFNHKNIWRTVLGALQFHPILSINFEFFKM